MFPVCSFLLSSGHSLAVLIFTVRLDEKLSIGIVGVAVPIRTTILAYLAVFAIHATLAFNASHSFGAERPLGGAYGGFLLARLAFA